MGATLSTSSGCEGSTVKLSCPNGHIMEGSKVKYGRFDKINVYQVSIKMNWSIEPII